MDIAARDAVLTSAYAHKSNNGSDHSFIDQSVVSGANVTFGNITVTGTVDSVDVAALKTDVDGFPDSLKNLAATEIAELEAIGTTTISAGQWGYVGNLDQDLITTSTVKFDNIYAGGRPWFDVVHYGAYTDGTHATETTTAIQDAIDAAEVNGGTVFFPQGDYLIESELQILTDEAVILQGVSWDGGSKITGEFAGTLIRFDKATNYNYRGGMQDLHIDGVAKTTGRHGVEFGMCISPFVNRCFFEQVDKAIIVGEGAAELTQKMSISNIDFDYVEIGIFLQSQIETSIWNVHGSESAVRGGTALIYADPGVNDHYDSLFVDNVKSLNNCTYGIYINIAVGTAGSNGRNHIGTFNNIICEASTSSGLYIDADKSYGRCRIYNWYGDIININNCPDLTLIGVQAHGANNITNCNDRKVIGCHISGSGDLFDIERLGTTIIGDSISSPNLLNVVGNDKGITFIDTGGTVGKKGTKIQSDGDALNIQRCSDVGAYEATHVSVDQDTGNITMASLTGTGSRTVVADANGVLSAP